MSLSALNPHDPCVHVLRLPSCSTWCQKISGKSECWLASLCQERKGALSLFRFTPPTKLTGFLFTFFPFIPCVCFLFLFTRENSFTQRHPPLFKPSLALILHPSYNILLPNISIFHFVFHIYNIHIHVHIHIIYHLLSSTPTHSAFSKHLLQQLTRIISSLTSF